MHRRDFLKWMAAAAAGTAGTRLIDAAAQAAASPAYFPVILGQQEPAYQFPTPLSPSPTPTALPTQTASPNPSPTATAVATRTPTTPPIPSQTPTQAVPTASPSSHRVVHIRSNAAHSWAGAQQSPAYWNYANPTAIDEMTDQGLMALTNTSSPEAAWQALLPGNISGKKVAIKVNFNSVTLCSESQGCIDAVYEPVGSLVRGLKNRGVDPANIWIYDAIKPIPERFAARARIDGVLTFGEQRDKAAFTGPAVQFFAPGGVIAPDASNRLSNILVETDYLINMPILKQHNGAGGFTGSFKNHFGSIQKPSTLHAYINPVDGSRYSTAYNPMVDIYRSPQILGKTILTVGDAIFAHRGGRGPSAWSTFGGQTPKSLFFSVDPVALDCVLMDFLNAETRAVHAEADRYLRLAAQTGLGLYERSDPWNTGYTQINFVSQTL